MVLKSLSISLLLIAASFVSAEPCGMLIKSTHDDPGLAIYSIQPHTCYSFPEGRDRVIIENTSSGGCTLYTYKYPKCHKGSIRRLDAGDVLELDTHPLGYMFSK